MVNHLSVISVEGLRLMTELNKTPAAAMEQNWKYVF